MCSDVEENIYKSKGKKKKVLIFWPISVKGQCQKSIHSDTCHEEKNWNVCRNIYCLDLLHRSWGLCVAIGDLFENIFLYIFIFIHSFFEL